MLSNEADVCVVATVVDRVVADVDDSKQALHTINCVVACRPWNELKYRRPAITPAPSSVCTEHPSGIVVTPRPGVGAGKACAPFTATSKPIVAAAEAHSSVVSMLHREKVLQEQSSADSQSLPLKDTKVTRPRAVVAVGVLVLWSEIVESATEVVTLDVTVVDAVSSSVVASAVVVVTAVVVFSGLVVTSVPVLASTDVKTCVVVVLVVVVVRRLEQRIHKIVVLPALVLLPNAVLKRRLPPPVR